MTSGSERYDRNLDLLRATAVLLVLITHTLNFTIAPIEAQPVLQLLGNMGVTIFFVHTSLVLMRSLERTNPRGVRLSAVARDFYLRRIFRIYPLAVLTVVAVVALHLRREPSDPVWVQATAREIVANLTLTQNLWGARSLLAPLWSLPYEVQMYVLLPFFFVVVSTVKSPRLLVALAALSIVVAATYALLAVELRGLWRLSVFNYLPCFAAGVLAYRGCKLTRPRLPAWLWPLVIASTITGISFTRPGMDLGYWRAWVVAFAVAAFIPFLRELPRSPVTNMSHTVAKYSYGIYLVHLPVLDGIVRMQDYPWWARSLVFLGGITVLPFLLYHGLEEPMINLGAVLAGRLFHRRGAEAGLASTTPAP